MKCDLCSFETENRERFAGHRSAHVRRGELAKRIRVKEHVCIFCGKQFDTGPSLGGHLNFHRKTFSEIRSPGARKAFLIAKHGHKCTSCNNTMWMNQSIPLQLDHVDGNSDNNAEENFRLLCPNCHAFTPTYCGRNVGRFPGGERYRFMQAWRKKQSESMPVADGLVYTQEAAGSSPASP